MYNPSTIQDSIDFHQNENFKHENLYLKTSFYDRKTDTTVIFNFHSLILKYIDIINRDYIKHTELSDIELSEYKYNPKKFCKANYGTEELWSALLLVNNMISIVDFNKSKIKVFTPEITTLIEEIFVLEEREINENKENMSRIEKS